MTIAPWITGLGRRAARAPDPKGEPLKWYFATNEEGSDGQLGLHARLAVISARQNTRLRPHLITTGFRNAFIAWMEAHGVVIVEARQPLREAIEAADREGRYGAKYLGHWLRCEIPLIEREDPYVLYTDADVVFLRGINLPPVLPPYLACAPEFKRETTHYFNSGVILMNVAGLRESWPKFLAFARAEISGLRDDAVYHDQYAYNRFYRDCWTPLPPAYNWKPYWGDPGQARILHFHGAKLLALRMIFEQDLPYHELYWSQIGSLIAAFPEGYRRSVEATLAALGDAELPERDWIVGIARNLAAGPPPVPPWAVNLDFLNTEAC